MKKASFAFEQIVIWVIILLVVVALIYFITKKFDFIKDLIASLKAD